jgi:hypothetical protein
MPAHPTTFPSGGIMVTRSIDGPPGAVRSDIAHHSTPGIRMGDDPQSSKNGGLDKHVLANKPVEMFQQEQNR